MLSLVIVLVFWAVAISGKQSTPLLQPDHTHFVILTDPHGFYSGHRHDDRYDADYARISSFAERLKEKCRSIEGCDIYFLENGDMVDGGGLTDEPGAKAKTFPILNEIGFDARTIGNHELYNADTMRQLETLKSPNAFVLSNVATKKGFGSKCLFLSRNKGNTRVLVFGFLYNMNNYDPNAATVQQVEKAVQEKFFVECLQRSGVDSVVVLAHMDYRDPLLFVILSAIRNLHPTIPVVFATGHTHQRRSTRLDPFAFSLEAGKFSDTVGIVAFNRSRIDGNDLDFKHEYLNADSELLYAISGTDEDTPRALDIRKRLREVRKEFELDKVIGYAPRTLSIHVGFEDKNSLIRFWVESVVPATVLNNVTHCPGFFIGGSGSIRYDLFKGPVVADDIWGLAPFKEGFRVIRCLYGNILLELIQKLPSHLLDSVKISGLDAIRPFHPSLPPYVHSSLAGLSHRKAYDLVLGAYDSPAILKILNEQVSTTHGQIFESQPFRDGDIDQHSIWLKYFDKKETLVANEDDATTWEAVMR